MRMRSGYPKLKDEDKDKDDGKDGRGCPKLDHKAMIRNRSWARTRMKIRKLHHTIMNKECNTNSVDGRRMGLVVT